MGFTLLLGDFSSLLNTHLREVKKIHIRTSDLHPPPTDHHIRELFLFYSGFQSQRLLMNMLCFCIFQNLKLFVYSQVLLATRFHATIYIEQMTLFAFISSFLSSETSIKILDFKWPELHELLDCICAWFINRYALYELLQSVLAFTAAKSLYYHSIIDWMLWQ